MKSNNTMHYKGFIGSVSVSLSDGCVYGRIEYINDLVTFEASQVCDLQAEFEDAVDDYIETCEEIGKSPEKPMSGSFNVRTGPELHKKAHMVALDRGVSLNDIVKESLKQLVDHHNCGVQVVHLNIGEYRSNVQALGSEIEKVNTQHFTLNSEITSLKSVGQVH